MRILRAALRLLVMDELPAWTVDLNTLGSRPAEPSPPVEPELLRLPAQRPPAPEVDLPNTQVATKG